MATNLTQPNLEQDPGGSILAQLNEVTDPVDGASYTYVLEPISSRSLAGYAPWLRWTASTRTLTGTVPPAGGIWHFYYSAIDENGRDRVVHKVRFLIISFTDLTADLGNIAWRDNQRWTQDTGNDRVLLMSLPSFAPQGSGILLAGYQYLPIEGMLQLMPPGIASETQPLLVLEDVPNTGDDGIRAQAEYQTVIKFTRSRMRLQWTESYASHGGPYGLRRYAISKDTPPTWIYYDRGPKGTTGQGRIIMFWNGFINRFQERVIPGGIFVDAQVTPETRIHLGREVPRTPTDSWQLQATKANAPSIDWTA